MILSNISLTYNVVYSATVKGKITIVVNQYVKVKLNEKMLFNSQKIRYQDKTITATDVISRIGKKKPCIVGQ